MALDTLGHLHAEMMELAEGEPTPVRGDDGVIIEVHSIGWSRSTRS